MTCVVHIGLDCYNALIMLATERLPVQNTREEVGASALREWLDTHGIKAVLFDLDDTLLNTHKKHRELQAQFIASVAQANPELDPKELSDTFNSLSDHVYATHSVHRERWNAVVSLMAEKYGARVTPALYEAKDILYRVYDEPAELMPGAVETLEQFHQAAAHLGVVTHADEAWTAVKLDGHNIRKYFDTVTLADPWGYKGPEDWKRAIDTLGVRPEDVLVIGDNLTGDILAARSAGVAHTVWLPSPWDLYRNGGIPDDVIRADAIADVIPALFASPALRH